MTHFPLHDAMFCLNCSALFERGPDSCPCCQAGVFLYVSSLIKPAEIKQEIQDAKWMREMGVRL